MESITYDVIIVGAGPSGVVCYERIKTSSHLKVLLVDVNDDHCGSLKDYGIFYKNLNSLPIKEYDELLSGNNKGVDIYNYFHKKYLDKIDVTKFKVHSIEKKGDTFCIKNNENKTIRSKKVVLATGVKRKSLNVLDSCNITLLNKNKIKELSDKNNSAIIYIGSGDNAALKSIRMCKLYESKEGKFSRGRVSIVARPFFLERINKCFYDDLKHYENTGILNIFYTEEDIRSIEYTRTGLIKKIVFEHDVFKVDHFDGGLAGVYTGFESCLPTLTNCTEKDLVLVGDIEALSLNGVISITDAVNSSKVAAEKLIKS